MERISKVPKGVKPHRVDSRGLLRSLLYALLHQNCRFSPDHQEPFLDSQAVAKPDEVSKEYLGQDEFQDPTLHEHARGEVQHDYESYHPRLELWGDLCWSVETKDSFSQLRNPDRKSHAGLIESYVYKQTDSVERQTLSSRSDR